jgi:phenylpropionate dioxygenase-like ring-hydroxylating dioxygenase large terminal subunit
MRSKEILKDQEMTFLKNGWYVAALPREIAGSDILSRKLLGENVMIYRLADGGWAALRDRCPHRFVPLHMGQRVDDDIICPYHALRFNPEGKCVHNPHGEQKIPDAAKVDSYPIVERNGLIWIWLGDPALADADTIMDCSKLDDGDADSVGYGQMHFDANYVLLIENILDLSHVDHVHSEIINTQGQLSRQVPKLEGSDRSVVTRWRWRQTPAQLVVAPHLPKPDAEAQQFAEAHWHAPAGMLVSVGAWQEEGDKILQCWDYHFLTPESDNSSHYFFATRDNWKEGDPERISARLAGMLAAFELEDGPIVAAIDREMDGQDFWSLRPVLLTSDPGPVRARRLLEKLIADEAKIPVAVPA